MNNPTLRYVARAVLAGIASAIPLWVADQGWKEVLGYAALAALGFAGITAATPVDKSVGVGKES